MIGLSHPGRDGQQDTQGDTEQGGEQDTSLAGEQEGNRMRRDPEERDRLLEDKVPLRVPVQVGDNACHGDWCHQSPKRAG